MRQEKFQRKCREMIEFEEFVKTRASAYYGKKDIVKRLEEKGLKFDICFLYGYFGQKEDYGFVRPEMKFGYNCELLIQIRKATDRFADWGIMTVYNLISLTGIMRREILGLFPCLWFRSASVRTVDKLLNLMNKTAEKVLREGYDKVLFDIGAYKPIGGEFCVMRQEKFQRKCREMIEFEEFVKTRAAMYYGKKDIVKRLEEKGLKFDICFLYGYLGQKEDYGFVRPKMKNGYSCQLLIQIRKATDDYYDWNIMTIYNLIFLTCIMRHEFGIFFCPWFRRASVRTVDKLLDFMNETAEKVLREGYDKVLSDIVNSSKKK